MENVIEYITTDRDIRKSWSEMKMTDRPDIQKKTQAKESEKSERLKADKRPRKQRYVEAER